MSGKSKSDAASGSMFMAVLSCLVYSLMSNLMVLMNRYLVGKKYFGFEHKFFVVAVQAAVGVVALEVAKAQKVVSYEPYNSEIAKKWAPVTFFFVAMLYTGTQATAGLPIHIVTVFKNVTNIIIVFGEWRLFGEKVGSMVIASLAVMLFGAMMSSYSDVGASRGRASTFAGYFWMILNCLTSAGYALYMRYATAKSSLKITKFGMALYNNLIALPLLAPPMLLNGELISVWSDPLLSNLNFNMLLVLSGVFGIMLNVAAFWCVSLTSATTYATVGGLNKIPTTFIGVMLLGEHLKADTAVYVMFGIIGGLLYSYAKFKEGEEARRHRVQEARASESKV
ncbi:hypothetical protein ATCC90586_006867 [Pythium insidiosum]|nr:hypothetical protein ATCC90586_006867 [Pythium insidiosum]